ncbi:hypothetical protein J4212_01020 [Candidatus Woesearchaeota archaeon]|nr:hypothetical protein [Candidatus Woesearchaeota archaeon]
MDRKGAFSKIATMAILLIFLSIIIIAFLGPESILPQAAKAADWLAEKTFIQLKNEKPRPSVQADQKANEAFDSLVSLMRKQDYRNCIASRQPLSELKGNKIALADSGQGIVAELINKEGQRIKVDSVSGKKTCVISEGSAAISFYGNYLDSTKCTENCPKDYSEAKIEFTEEGSITVNGNKRGMDDAMAVFFNREGNLCFVPTYSGYLTPWGCDASQEGLDNDCIETIKKSVKPC